MSEANHAILRRWFKEVWTEGKESTIDELFAPGTVAHGLGDTEADIHGPAEFKEFWRNLRGAIPDMRVEVEDSVAEAHKAAVRIVLTGTHTGPGLGVKPTGRPVRIAGVIIVHIRDGRIVEGWNSYDQLGLLRQIGALPGHGGEDRFLKSSA